MSRGAGVYFGGGSGIRTRDEVTPIQSFQDCALDQLCDPSLNPQQKSTIKKGKNKQITQNPKTPAKELFKSFQPKPLPITITKNTSLI